MFTLDASLGGNWMDSHKQCSCACLVATPAHRVLPLELLQFLLQLLEPRLPVRDVIGMPSHRRRRIAGSVLNAASIGSQCFDSFELSRQHMCSRLPAAPPPHPRRTARPETSHFSSSEGGGFFQVGVCPHPVGCSLPSTSIRQRSDSQNSRVMIPPVAPTLRRFDRRRRFSRGSPSPETPSIASSCGKRMEIISVVQVIGKSGTLDTFSISR